jgi:hypothetical protein
MIVFWTVQAFGLITLVLYALSMQMKKKESLLILQVFSNLFFVFSCLLTNSPTGAALAGISIVRGIVFYIYKKRGLNPNIAAFIIFQAAILISTVFTWEGILSLFAFSANSTNMFAQWQDKMALLRILTIASCVLWMIYQFSAGMYAAMLSEACIIASSASALWKFRDKEKK